MPMMTAVAYAREEETFGAEKAELVPEKRNGELTVQKPGTAGKGGNAAHPAHLERIAANPVPQHAQRIDHHVIAMVCPAFFARVKPVSAMAIPACMNMTRNPHTRVHTMFNAIRLWPITSASFAAAHPLDLHRHDLDTDRHEDFLHAG